MANTRTTKAATPASRPVPRPGTPAGAISLAIAAATCASANTMLSVASAFGLEPVDTDAVRQGAREQVAGLAALLGPCAGEAGLRAALHRIVTAVVANACTAGAAYHRALRHSHGASAKVMVARNEGETGLAAHARQLSKGAAEAALASHAMLAAAQGAVTAYADATGETWVAEVRDGAAAGVASGRR